MTVELSEQQQEAVTASVQSIFRQGFAVVEGPGGSGKTELAKEVIRQVNRETTICCPTWMAVKEAVKRTGLTGASIHSTIAGSSYINEEGKLTFGDWHHENLPYNGLLWVDEHRMMGTKLGERLKAQAKKARCKLFLTGDPYQLGPVKDTSCFGDKDVTYLLTEIHRQAQGIGTDTLTGIRQRQLQNYNDVDTYLKANSNQADKSTEMRTAGQLTDRHWQHFLRVFEGDSQVICYTNAVRNRINALARVFLGFAQQGPVAVGERLLIGSNTAQFVNGDIIEVAGFEDTDRAEFDELIGLSPLDLRLVDVRCVDGRRGTISLTAAQRGQKEAFGPLVNNINQLGQSTQRFLSSKLRSILKTDYATAITAHKAQGSQFDNVMYIWQQRALTRFPNENEPFAFLRNPYTGMSRYRKNCIIAWSN